jgi:hypothetical protein
MRWMAVTLALLSSAAIARDLGQWEAEPTAVHEWFRKLMQPDNPYVSCCGQSDAYWADEYEASNGQYIAIITDDRPDGPLQRPHRELGERIVVPNHKIKWDAGNPTGHGVIFIGGGSQVYCYVAPGGI